MSFRMDWFDLLAVQETLESSPASQFSRQPSKSVSAESELEFGV